MKSESFLRCALISFIIVFVSFAPVTAQKKISTAKSADIKLNSAKKNALDYLDDTLNLRKFGIISDSIWGFAELGMQEFKSSATLIRALESEGFSVEKGVAGMPTCFVATWGKGKPVIGILGEFDALPMLSQKALTPFKDPVISGAPGHGCGHNTMGTAGVAAAIAVRRSMELNHLQGTVKFFGSPAEEICISRPYMVKAGLFKDVDAVIDNHASSDLSTAYGVSGTALFSVVFTFRGKTAHAAVAPWSGRSALDGVELMNIAANYLREHMFYTTRLHYVITEGGEAPNVVPDKASVWYYIRNTDELLEETFGRVVDCAKGAAIASGTILDTVRIITGVHQKHCNKVLAQAIQRNIELVGMPLWTDKEQAFARSLQKELGAKTAGYPLTFSPLKQPDAIQVGGGSSDVGEVTMIAPTATVNFPEFVPGAISHHWSAVASGYGTAAWKGLNTGAKVIAATALDLLISPILLEEVKTEFYGFSKNNPYKSFLPVGAKPPLEMNKDLMEKYSKTFLNN